MPPRMNDPTITGHVFRSKLLDKFAAIEGWAISCLASEKQPSSAAPLGQKIESLAKICAKNPPVFKSAKKIAERLKRLKPYQELRSTIVHSQIESLTDTKDEALSCFRNVALINAPARYHAVVLYSKDYEDILREVSKIYNELKQLTPVLPKPPSPQPPLPAATAGP